MPTVLSNYQHELTTDDDDGDPPLFSLLFGTEDTFYLTTAYPLLEGDEGRVGDVQRFRGDGVSLGEDFDGPKRATFEIGVLTDRESSPEGANHDAVEAFETVWKDKRVRNRSTKYAVLRSRMVPGRTRRAYGRPRRFSETPGPTTRRGYTPILCDFLSVDGTWYDDEAQSAESSLARTGIDGTLAASTLNGAGQWVFATIPGPGNPDGYLPSVEVNTLEPTTFTVGGSRPTWPVVKFTASVASSVLNPSATIGGLRIGLIGTLTAGQSVTVDTRPWSRQVSPAVLSLTGDTPTLDNCSLYPGTYQLAYDGIDVTGGSTCEVSWRNAYSRW